MNTQQILNLIEEKITLSGEKVFDNEGFEDFEVEEVESKHQDGFIPWTDGGFSATAWSRTTDEYFTVQTKGIKKAIEQFSADAESYAEGCVLNKFPDADLENLTEEQEDLYYEEYDSYLMGENSVLNTIQCYYYSPSNHRAKDNKHTIAVQGVVNLEAPYHRDGNMEDFIEFTLTFDTLEELEKHLDQSLEQVEIWFNGEMFEEFPERELKIERL